MTGAIKFGMHSYILFFYIFNAQNFLYFSPISYLSSFLYECFFYQGFRSYAKLCLVSHHNFLFFFCALLFPPEQACRERIKGLQSKITAFSQRMNLINQRGTPDSEEMTSWEEFCCDLWKMSSLIYGHLIISIFVNIAYK